MKNILNAFSTIVFGGIAVIITIGIITADPHSANTNRMTEAEVISGRDGSAAVKPLTAETEKLAPKCDGNLKCKIYNGRVLPFSIIRAKRNANYKDGMIGADVSISVVGGAVNDWMATAVYAAEQSLINGVTFSQVHMYVPNPWGDSAPTSSKTLATVYYNGPDPDKGPWKDNPWMILAANHRAGSLPDIEFDKLSNDMLEKAYANIKDPSKIKDPDKISDRIDDEAKATIISKYHLPTNWKPLSADNSDLINVQPRRDQVSITNLDDVHDSIAALQAALSPPKIPMLSFSDPLFVKKGSPACSTEDEVKMYYEHAPADCAIIPVDMGVAIIESAGFFGWSHHVRFIGIGSIVNAWVPRDSLKN